MTELLSGAVKTRAKKKMSKQYEAEQQARREYVERIQRQMLEDINDCLSAGNEYALIEALDDVLYNGATAREIQSRGGHVLSHVVRFAARLVRTETSKTDELWFNTTDEVEAAFASYIAELVEL